ncbi:unnamed protein product [Toxocara canis]|uniref:Metalloendopeptidase n=1 Tax=Toxocara canis TaxID=6265 RepID=A0A183V6G1_TOXCA|nr:unnamed protein product [Toxocara canis]
MTIIFVEDSEELDIIWKAMRSIEQNTCIRFEERKSEEDFLELQNKIHHGCYTGVGRMRGRNVMMLEANNMLTCIERDIVIHELMHTIGLWHEHMRNDRDKYIRIRYENIAPRYRSQFDMVPEAESNTFGTNYNYRSVMHYGKKAFSKRRGLITIETLDPVYQDVIGKARDAAPSDYYKICAMYECNRCMGKPFKNVESMKQTSSFATTKLSTKLRRSVDVITSNDQTFRSSDPDR